MARLTRAQQQERTRASVLVAARAEFAERGYADAKIDRIAERAELTRGAVYSNFPSKRALYLAVLVDSLDDTATTEAPPADGPADALGSFARGWLERLPLSGDSPAGAGLRLLATAGLFDDDRGRAALAQVTWLEALLLGLALESYAPRVRRVRLAELVLTLLNGSGHLAGARPVSATRSTSRAPAATWPDSTSPTPSTRRTCPTPPPPRPSRKPGSRPAN
ncbi:TetR/AcrR family transcriptional regulator [Actinomadura sp. CNU-125]|uniref:TetR/AcrR family transcriptional regulator n=1 Tax=Actinomadura sp. CNU-125 TaxID=1904961 RepID=UPI000B1DA7CB|nr:TetR family transcriptional regulator [Actinomadura sp. CNU-125]